MNIDIKEGDRAKIRQINIVGNNAFKAKDILETLTLKTPKWNSWYKDDDRYSRESLQGDLEKIESYYQDRGYANVHIDSVQVAIAPDKSNVFITVNVTEGMIYKISEVKLAGNLVVAEAQLRRLVLVQPGPDLFAEDHHRLAGADQEPPRRRGLLLRQGRAGAGRSTTPSARSR